MEIQVVGYGDDAVGVSGGGLDNEWNCYDDSVILIFSDGTKLKAEYTNDGLWRINRIEVGTSEFNRKEATDPDSDEYSDVITLSGDIKWVCEDPSNFNRTEIIEVIIDEIGDTVRELPLDTLKKFYIAIKKGEINQVISQL